jgi:hypothetical protein
VGVPGVATPGSPTASDEEREGDGRGNVALVPVVHPTVITTRDAATNVGLKTFCSVSNEMNGEHAHADASLSS